MKILQGLNEEQLREKAKNGELILVLPYILDPMDLIDEYYTKSGVITYLEHPEFIYKHEKCKNAESPFEAEELLAPLHHTFRVIFVEEEDTIPYMTIDEFADNPIGILAVPVLEEGGVGKDYWDALEECNELLTFFNQNISQELHNIIYKEEDLLTYYYDQTVQVVNKLKAGNNIPAVFITINETVCEFPVDEKRQQV